MGQRSVSLASYLTKNLRKKTKAWALRLIPSNPKDTWRGPTPHFRGFHRASHFLAHSQSFFIFRCKKAPCSLTPPVYSLCLEWRKRWRILVPLAAADGSMLVTDSVKLQLYRESLLLNRVASMLGRYVRSLWDTLLWGVGGTAKLKLRYKGKSFKWHRRKGALMLRFGHSHLVALKPYPGVRWRRFGRMKILLFGSNWWDLVDFAQAVCWWRPVNVYHGRGIRLRRQAVLRKAGKVSAYR